MLTFGIIVVYFVVRLIFWADNTISVNSTRKMIIRLGVVLWLPIVTGSYWFLISNYDPCTMCSPPMPVAGFLAWITFLVTDCLYQLLMLSRTTETTVSMN